MKCAFILVVALAVAVAVTGSPATQKPSCKSCSDDYKPVCANVDGTPSKPKQVTFGSSCVLEKYRCETGKSVPKIRDSECDKGSPVRLS